MRSLIYKLVCVAVMAASVGRVAGQLTYERLKVFYDTPWTYKNLQLIPVKFKGPGAPRIENEGASPVISLQDAMTKGKIKINEIKYQNGADVNVLEVKNTSKSAVMVTGGEMLGGGKQDRMVGETKILAPGKKDFINVYCIEKDRWDRRPKRFRHEGSVNSDLRKVMDTKKRQPEIWKEIARQFKAEKKSDDTWAYKNLYNGHNVDTGYLNYFTRKYAASDSLFSGFLAITGNRIINAELFNKPELTNTAFLSMLKGLIPTAIVNGAAPTLDKKTQGEFMDNILKDEIQQKKFVEKRGKIEKYEGRVVHLIAYGD
jgi:hypothetical protein